MDIRMDFIFRTSTIIIIPTDDIFEHISHRNKRRHEHAFLALYSLHNIFSFVI